MNDQSRTVRKKAADCIRRFLSGNVSCDHLVEEFRSSEDREVREVIELVEKATENIDKYERLDRSEAEIKGLMENLIARLEE